MGGEGSAHQTFELFLTEEWAGPGPEDPPSVRPRAWLVDSLGVMVRSQNCLWTGLGGPGIPGSETCPLSGHSVGGLPLARCRPEPCPYVNTPAAMQQTRAFSGARGPREIGLEPRV